MTVPDEKMLCYCRNVRYGEVRASIERTGARRVQQVMDDCTAGTGCRTCHNEIQDLINEHEAANPRGGFGRLLRKLLGRA